MSTTMYMLTPTFKIKEVESVGDDEFDKQCVVLTSGKRVNKLSIFNTRDQAYSRAILDINKKMSVLDSQRYAFTCLLERKTTNTAIPRLEGFYWVNFDGEWLIAEWTDGKWVSCHHSRFGVIHPHEISEIENIKLTHECDDDSRFVRWNECRESISAGRKIGRENGFYWMNAYGSWSVVEWVYGNWKNIDVPSKVTITTIERRIVRTEPEVTK